MFTFIAKQLRDDLKNKYGGIQSDGLEIIGPDIFRKRIKEAIDLLKQKDIVNYNRITNLLKFIVFSDSNSSGVSVPLQTYFIKKITVSESQIDWLSSLLVHEAMHVRVKGKIKHVSNYRNEKIATSVQVRCLEKLGRDVGNRQEYVDKIMGTKWWTFSKRIRKLFADVVAIIRE